MNLLQLQPQLYSTTLAHVYANLPRSINTVNYEIVRTGEKKTARKLIFIGTEHGNVCGYHEASSFIDDVPVIFLRLSDASKDHTGAHKATAVSSHSSGASDSHLKHLVKSLINVNRIGTKLGVHSVSSHSHDDSDHATAEHSHSHHHSKQHPDHTASKAGRDSGQGLSVDVLCCC